MDMVTLNTLHHIEDNLRRLGQTATATRSLLSRAELSHEHRTEVAEALTLARALVFDALDVMGDAIRDARRQQDTHASSLVVEAGGIDQLAQLVDEAIDAALAEGPDHD